MDRLSSLYYMKLIEYMYRITLTHHQHFMQCFILSRIASNYRYGSGFTTTAQHEEGCRGGEEEEIRGGG